MLMRNHFKISDPPEWLICSKSWRLGTAGMWLGLINLLKPGDISVGLWIHDHVIKWKHFPRYWPFVQEIHRSLVDSPHKGQWRRALMFSLICAWMNGWVNNREAGDLRRHHTHYDVTVMGHHCFRYRGIWINNNLSLTWLGTPFSETSVKNHCKSLFMQ